MHYCASKHHHFSNECKQASPLLQYAHFKRMRGFNINFNNNH